MRHGTVVYREGAVQEIVNGSRVMVRYARIVEEPRELVPVFDTEEQALEYVRKLRRRERARIQMG